MTSEGRGVHDRGKEAVSGDKEAVPVSHCLLSNNAGSWVQETGANRGWEELLPAAVLYDRTGEAELHRRLLLRGSLAVDNSETHAVTGSTSVLCSVKQTAGSVKPLGQWWLTKLKARGMGKAARELKTRLSMVDVEQFIPE